MSEQYFAVEGGLVLELARQHVAEVTAQAERNRALIAPLDVEEYRVSILDGTVSVVRFVRDPHPDFKKPDRKGWAHPKKGTEWHRLFSEQQGYDARGYDLAKALGVPTTLRYSTENSSGSASISRGFSSGVGFLWLGEEGPFALYIPDVRAKAARYEADGYVVDDECKNFNPNFDGARPILKEEWELTVAQHELERAKMGAAA